MTPPNALVRKLTAFHPLDDADVDLLEAGCRPVHPVEARRDVIREGEAPGDVHLILSGFACRYKVTRDGGRQIVAFLVPGDFCDLHVFVLDAMDHGIATLSPCEVVHMPRETILALTRRPAIARAFWWATLVDEAVLRAWIVNMGQRSAEERLGHLLCELNVRLRTVGLATDDTFRLPLTQQDLADTLGITVVHVNRMLTNLKERGLVALSSRQVTLLDPEGLAEMSDFSPNYLHLRNAAHERDRPVPPAL